MNHPPLSSQAKFVFIWIGVHLMQDAYHDSWHATCQRYFFDSRKAGEDFPHQGKARETPA